MQNKASLFILGVGMPLAYYFYRDVAYDLTADVLGDESRKKRKMQQLSQERTQLLNQEASQSNGTPETNSAFPSVKDNEKI